MMGLFLTVIIPCYNEKENLQRGVLEVVDKFLESKKFSWEVLISDDGSTDASVSIVKKQIKVFPNFKLLENPHGGKPSALWYGIQKAKGKYVLFTDMDQSTPITQLDKLLLPLDDGYNIVIGSRGFERKDFPLYRKLGSMVFAAFRKSMLLKSINDTQCGFKLFERTAVAKAFVKLEFFKVKARTKGWKVTSYDVELLHILEKMGEKIKEVEVSWKDEDVSTGKGGGGGRYFRESKEMLTQILRVKINDLKGEYQV